MADSDKAMRVAPWRDSAIEHRDLTVVHPESGHLPGSQQTDRLDQGGQRDTQPQIVRSRKPADAEDYPWLTMGIASLLLFILLVEWLRPMQQASAITQVYMLEPFQLALFGFVALDYLRIHGLLLWPLKLAVALLVISVFFYDSYLYEPSWWETYIAVTVRDLEAVARSHTTAISGENRTLLLLIGMALVIYSLHYIVVRRQYVGWFVAATIGYLAGLQIVFGLPTTSGIILSLAAGLLMIVLLAPVRWRSILGFEMSATTRLDDAVRDPSAGGVTPNQARNQTAVGDAAWMRDSSGGTTGLFAKAGAAARSAAGYAGAICIALAALATGWLAAEDEPRLSQRLSWNALEFAQDVARWTNGRWSIPADRDWSGFANLSLSGYSSGDYELGGSVIPANFPIFTARSGKLTYWRGETKSYYDGAGWHDSPAGSGDSSDGSTQAMDDELTIESFLSMTPIEQEVHLDSTAAMFLQGTLFAGGTITDVAELAASDGRLLDPQLHPPLQDAKSRRYMVDAGEAVLGSYRITVVPVPHDSLDAPLIDEAYRAAVERGITSSLTAEEGTHDSLDAPLIDEAYRTAVERGTTSGLTEEERLRYLQLPEMGERVYELAAQLTAWAETDLDKARAIAAYLRTTYTYDLNANDKPGEDSEFVEHFLFEQRTGYCDHFSTAMAVLLRMNGIPSRWVKGFAPGEVQVDEAGHVWSDVRALHAHSWVEAYIPGIGWVAFEPTPSYAGSLESASVVLAAKSPDSDGMSSGGVWWQGPAWILASETMKEVEQMDGDWLAWLEMKWTAWKERFMSVPWSEAVIGGTAAAAVIALIVILYMLLRHRLSYMRLERRISQMERRGGTALMLELMWQRIIRKYGPIQPGQTLREYVQSLELRRDGQREALVELALLYEAIRYDERLPERISRGRMSRLWREAIG